MPTCPARPAAGRSLAKFKLTSRFVSAIRRSIALSSTPTWPSTQGTDRTDATVNRCSCISSRSVPCSNGRCLRTESLAYLARSSARGPTSQSSRARPTQERSQCSVWSVRSTSMTTARELESGRGRSGTPGLTNIRSSAQRSAKPCGPSRAISTLIEHIHTFVTSDGSPYPRFRRALQRGDLASIELASRELRRCRCETRCGSAC
jgi:hypothetical protein